MIGARFNRVEAREKVTGAAVYTGDVKLPGMVHAVLVGSAISAGRVRSIDTTRAQAAAGVLAVITHLNRPQWSGTPDSIGYAESRFPLADDHIHHHGQYLAVVVAETREQAAYAASLVRIDYEERDPVPTLEAALPGAHPPVRSRFFPEPYPTDGAVGDPEGNYAKAPVTVEAEYRTPYRSHAPMEPNATVAVWDGPRLTIYETSQATQLHRPVVAAALGIPVADLRMVSRLVGGAFGNKTDVRGHTLLAAAAARRVGRPVRLELTRLQVFTGTGHQSPIIQTVRLGADRDGRLQAIVHSCVNGTTMLDDRSEGAVFASLTTYASPGIGVHVRVASMHMGASSTLRAPADGPSMFALDSAMDELAYELDMDPLELRRRNHTDRWPGPLDGRPWSGKQLLECYDLGAQVFGWADRPPRPRAMRDGADWVGYGMATALRVENRGAARAEVSIYRDGTAEVRATTHEIGTGNLTTMVQVAATGTGIPFDRVRIRYGDTDLPAGAPTQGSRTSGNLGTAVHLAATQARSAAIQLAVADPASPLYGLPPSDVVADGGRLSHKDDPRRGETYRNLLSRNNIDEVRQEGRYDPKQSPYATATFGAHFTEVRVSPERVRVTRHVGVFAVGRILNHKTARNQAQGGIVFGIGGALTERLVTDPVDGRFVGAALTDYHVPVHADTGDIDVHFVEEPDYNAHPLGAKGLGEVVCIGVDAAIANAVHHATGLRVRDLPITPERLTRV